MVTSKLVTSSCFTSRGTSRAAASNKVSFCAGGDSSNLDSRALILPHRGSVIRVYTENNEQNNESENRISPGVEVVSIFFGHFLDTFGGRHLLCHQQSNGQMTMLNSQMDYVVSLDREFCTNGKKVISADLNGDGTLDLLCHQADGSIRYWLAFGGGGLFTPIDGTLVLGIYLCNNVIYAGDLNRDGKDDLICHDCNGRIKYFFSRSTADSVVFEHMGTQRVHWCNGLSDIIVSGRLNADSGIDFLCHTGRSRLESALVYSAERNAFEEKKFENTFVDFCNDAKEFLLIGDIDGDGYGDLVCKSSDALGQIIIVQNKPGEYFTDQSVRKELRFCENGGPKQFFVVEMKNEDKLSDLLCQTTNGTRRVYTSKCSF